jgi:recombinational DNA repair protein RecR
MAAGNRHLGYKDALNRIEATSPGTKAAFYFEFLDKAAHLFTEGVREEQEQLGTCLVCGGPSTGEICAFCRLAEKAGRHEPVTVAQPVRLGRGGSR